jgi:hypothetical protein
VPDKGISLADTLDAERVSSEKIIKRLITRSVARPSRSSLNLVTFEPSLEGLQIAGASPAYLKSSKRYSGMLEGPR